MSLLLVSHDLPSVKALCRNAIVLHEGRPVFHGPSAAERRQWRAGTSESGSRQAEVVGLRLLDASGRAATVFGVGERVICDCWIEAREPLAELQFSFEISTRHNFVAFVGSDLEPSIQVNSSCRVRPRWISGAGTTANPRLRLRRGRG